MLFFQYDLINSDLIKPPFEHPVFSKNLTQFFEAHITLAYHPDSVAPTAYSCVQAFKFLYGLHCVCIEVQQGQTAKKRGLLGSRLITPRMAKMKGSTTVATSTTMCTIESLLAICPERFYPFAAALATYGCPTRSRGCISQQAELTSR